MKSKIYAIGSGSHKVLLNPEKRLIARYLTNSNISLRTADNGLYIASIKTINEDNRLRESLEHVFKEDELWVAIEQAPDQKILNKYDFKSRNNTEGIAYQMSFMSKYAVVMILRYGGKGEQLQLKLCYPVGIRDLILDEYKDMLQRDLLVVDMENEKMFFASEEEFTLL